MKRLIALTLVATITLVGCKTSTIKKSAPAARKSISIASDDGPPCPCCPDCGTNGTSFTPTNTPVEYPLDALLVRNSIISFSQTNESDAYLATTNYPWVKTTNNTLTFGGAATLSYGFQTNTTAKVATYTTNTLANHVYVSQFASDLAGPWSTYSDHWTNAVNVEHLDYAYISNPMNVNGFFRTRDITLQWLTNSVNQDNGTGTCGGNYTALSVFIQPNTNSWGYAPDFATKLHKISVVGDTNAWIQVVGRFGQQFCAKGEVTITGNNPATGTLDPYFRWVVAFDTSPGSNCVVMLTGFIDNYP